MKRALKQIWYDAKCQPVITMVTIAGTAFAIFLISIVIMMNEAKTVPFSPEMNRDRLLFCPILMQGSEIVSMAGPFDTQTARDICVNIPGLERWSISNESPRTRSVMVENLYPIQANTRTVDGEYWNIYDHKFLHGMPFDSVAVSSARKVAVISSAIAKKVYATTDVVGREIKIERIPYKVVGVVENVSPLATFGYSDIWIPNEGRQQGCLIMLCEKDADINDVKDATHRSFEVYRSKQRASGAELVLYDIKTPFTQREYMLMGQNVMESPDLEKDNDRQFVIYLILLLVPAINLAGMSQSRLRQRVADIGVRRAFGGTRISVFLSVLLENMIVTLAGAVIGLMAALAFALFGADLVFGDTQLMVSTSTVYIGNVLHWSTFAWIVAFCFILNMLSSGLPALQAARMSPVKALSVKK